MANLQSFVEQALSLSVTAQGCERGREAQCVRECCWKCDKSVVVVADKCVVSTFGVSASWRVVGQ